MCEEALDAIVPVGPQGHRLGHVGPLTFCLKCSCYSVHIGRGLLDQCQGPPRTNSSADKTRRYTKKLLMAGKHPGTRKLVEGSTQDQLDALIQWSQAEERADLFRTQLDACPAPRVAQPSVPAVAEVAAVAAATPPSSGGLVARGAAAVAAATSAPLPAVSRGRGLRRRGELPHSGK